jgi:DNA-binding MarR family transcriptional regulator
MTTRSQGGIREHGPAPIAAHDRPALIRAIDDAARLMADRREQLTRALAERFGIPVADAECLELACLRGGVTVSELAAAKGVTVGAISQSLNRLEAKSLSRREADPADRRRTIVHARSAAARRIAPVHEKLNQALMRQWSTYSDDELETVRKVMLEGAATIDEQVQSLAAKAARGPRARDKPGER